MIGPDPGWELIVQDNGRLEMTRRLLYQGPVAAAEFAVMFQASVDKWLQHSGHGGAFVFEPIELPSVS